MGVLNRQICYLIFTVVVGFGISVAVAHQCSHGHSHQHDAHHYQDGDVSVVKSKQQKLLPEELAEEEDLKLYGFGSRYEHDEHHHGHGRNGSMELSGLGLWIHALGCSLLVSMASLICLIILPLIFIQGKPSKAVVDSLALFGAGAMLGDAFLHQLPHAFGGEHSHSHDHHDDHGHNHVNLGHSHSHSLKDLSVGLSVLAGIVLFLLVEKLVRYVEDYSGGGNAWSHGHHHHHHKHNEKMKDHNGTNGNLQGLSQKKNNSKKMSTDEKVSGSASPENPLAEKPSEQAVPRKRNTGNSTAEDKCGSDSTNVSSDIYESKSYELVKPPSNLVFGYLNLFSDGVHNFTDGMALGSAFLLYGSIGGWSRTMFLLAHELPQEIGDFGILVRSGFSVSKALFFNFLSALVALVGTALALTMGQDPGQSSLIEGFTAGGFIYIAVAGVLAEMNNGSSALRNTAIQLTSLLMGMGVALCISLVE